MSSTTATGPSSTASTAPASTTDAGSAQQSQGITLVAFITALATALVIFGIQMGFFLLLRNKLARIFKPKTYLVPERERTEPPPVSPWGLLAALVKFKDRDIIKKCGLDAFFFLRYLQTLLVIFIPIACLCIPILVPINYIGGIGQNFAVSNDTNSNDTATDSTGQVRNVTGFDTLAWGNVRPADHNRRWAHLIMAIAVILWVCFVFFWELRVYVKVRQDYLTSAEHRLRASANTVLVSSIPDKWLSEDALRGLFDVFPGGIRNVWLTRDLTKLLEKIHKRDYVSLQLESAESDLIRAAKKKQLKVRAAEEKKANRKQKTRGPTKEERVQRDAAEDAEAQRRAEGTQGLSAGEHDEVPHTITDAALEGEKDPKMDTSDVEEEQESEPEGPGGAGIKIPIIGGGLAKVGQGLRKGVNVVGEAGQGILGGAKAVQQGVDAELGRTGGFQFVKSDAEPSSAPPTRGSDRRRIQTVDEEPDDKPKVSFASDSPISRHTHGQGASSDEPFRAHGRTGSNLSHDSGSAKPGNEPGTYGNTVRKVNNWDDMYITEETRWWQFWKPPTGGYASPVPQAGEGTDYLSSKETEKTFWQKVKSVIPFLGDDEEPIEYEKAFDHDYSEDKEKEPGAEWRKWLKEKDRPHHRVPWFDWTPGWFPGFPLLHKKVDTIYWCRAELARLNLEIDEDQEHPERYPVMNSAFIQFNNQVAAHMACQSVTHHVPKQMAPRIVEISPDDVIWDNMAIKWWDGWIRSAIVFAICVGMTILWAIPVAFTSSLAQLDVLIAKAPWLGFLQTNDVVWKAVQAIAGVLPALMLAILLALVPMIMNFLAGIQGAKTGSQKSETVQTYYFVFLFVQIFLVVSIAGLTFQQLGSQLTNITNTPELLAQNLPRAANYFFSYMILQALSVSSGTLLQIGTLFVWYILARILDNTARAKWTRNTQLPSVTWGSFFPVYTNFACIGLIYSVVAPIISIFMLIMFSLFWVAQRYQMLYVTRFKTDTGGVLYPRALNQTFTGIYVMELCLIGLFFLERDENGNVDAVPQAIIMLVVTILTILYQYLLNTSFGPLLRYLPITFEDEAVLRDEAFQRAQDRRLGLIPDDDENTTLTAQSSRATHTDDIELQKLPNGRRNGSSKHKGINPVRSIVHAGSWAARGGKTIRKNTFGKAEQNLRQATVYRRQRRAKDLEAQRAIGDALYGGFHDEIEDLTPDERDVLVRKAFQHYALRARRPTVWIPQDDIGVSDDEILRTREFSDHIWVSNEGTALDSKVRVLYGRNPPDFSEVDIINL